MDVEAERPLNILPSWRLQYKVMVCQVPVTGHNTPSLSRVKHKTEEQMSFMYASCLSKACTDLIRSTIVML